jgi:N-6 DNA methylase
VTRREFYRIVQALLPKAGGARELLGAAAGRMRYLRGMPAKRNGSLDLGELDDLLRQDDALGRVYQAINSPALETAYRETARTGRKFAEEEIPAVTQLFTPKWVVEFLLHNTLGILWRQMHPDSQLRWDWMVDRKLPGIPAKPAAEIRICDPACGTMNFGLAAVDMLRLIYREEGLVEESKIDESILRNNLIGFDIDPVAIELARESLRIKLGRKISGDQLRVADVLFGLPSIRPVDILVTNPPYLSARNLEAKIVAELKKQFPAAWRDFYACFLLQSLQMLSSGGRAGILCMHSFMFTAAFEKLRRELAALADVETAAHFGPGLFDVGNPGTLQTIAAVFSRKPADEAKGIFFRLTEERDKTAALRAAIGDSESAIRFELTQQQLASAPRGAWMYWIGERRREIFRKFTPLGDIAPPRQGLATTDNLRFVRYWWEVEKPGEPAPRRKWIPYAKGGRFRRWYEPPRHRVDWENDGAAIKQSIVTRYPYLQGKWSWVAKNSEFYGRAGITYSYLTSGSFSARELGEGTFFDVAGSALFPGDPLPLLGVLNSSAVHELLGAINPTVNFQVGDLRLLPVPTKFPQDLRREVARAIELTRQLDRFDQTSPDFFRPANWDGGEMGQLAAKLAEVENRIDRMAAKMYGLPIQSATRKVPELDRVELARHWISYALGIWLGRWGNRPAGKIARLAPLDSDLADNLRNILAIETSKQSAGQIESAVGGLGRFLGKTFLPWHNRLYRGRPVFWGFGSEEKIFAVHAMAADVEILSEILGEVFGDLGEKLPRGWGRWIDDGISVNLAPLSKWLVDRALQKDLVDLLKDLRRGKFEESKTAAWLLQRPANRGSSVESARLRGRRRPLRKNSGSGSR